MPIFLALVAVPLIEIALFIEVGGWLGLWPTLAIVLLTAAAGTILLRAQGLATVGELKRRVEHGEDPTPPIAHGAMILASGLLLLTPGFFTDAVGLALLAPPVRAAVIRYARKRIVAAHFESRGRPGPQRRAETIEGEYEVVDGDKRHPPGDGGRHGGGGYQS